MIQRFITERPYLLGFVLMLALTAVYWNHFDNAFHFDDSHTIVNNGYIKDIGNLPLFFTDAKTTSSLPLNQAYRPMITSLNAIDHWLAGGLHPEVFHWHIYLEFLVLLVLFHLLLMHVFRAADGKDHRLLAVLGAAFFAFHAATAETINYVIARSDGFSTLMVLAGALIYMRSSGWKKELGLIPFLIGCFAKPTALMLAPILLLHDLFVQRPAVLVKEENASLIPKILGGVKSTTTYFLLGAAAYFFTRSMFSDTWKPSDVNMLDYLNTQPYIFWIYIRTFFLPIDLTADTDLGLIKEAFAPKVLWGLLVITLSLILAWFAARKRHTLPIAFGILWFYVALIPSSSVIPLAEVMNHHRTFFPYMGLVMASVWAAYLLFRKLVGTRPSAIQQGVAVTAVALVLSAHAYGTYERNEVWDNDESLWHDVTVKSPNNGRGLMNYGLTAMRKGDMETAISYFERALNTSYGRHPYLSVNLGIAKNSLARQTNDPQLKQEAAHHLKDAVTRGPGYPECHYHYAHWLAEQNRTGEAVKHLQKALELSPAHQQSASLLESLTQTAEMVIRKAEERAKANDTPEAYLDLSLKYYNHGQYEKCIRTCEKALELRPDYAEAYNNICSAYNKLRRFEEAEQACEKALTIRPNYPLAKGNLDWAKQMHTDR